MSYWLHLFETDLKEINGVAPFSIDLSKGMRNGSNCIVIGRGSPAYPADVVVNARINQGAEIISRNHAKFIFAKEHGWRIDDMGAVNGIFVNRKRVLTATLTHGDVVQLGGVSNVPVGETLKETGLSIKYRVAFSENEPKSAKKAKRSSTSNEGSAEKSTAKKVKKEASFDLEKDKAHAALSLLFTEKDTQIADLQNQLVKAEAARAQVHERAEMFEKSYEHAASELRKVKIESMDYKARYFDMKARHDALASSSEVPQRKEEPTLYIPTCRITLSAMEILLQCKLCEGTISDPVVMECSHGFCRACIMKCDLSFCPTCKAPLDTSKAHTSSSHLDAIVGLVRDTKTS